jgi:hypothetical protein
MACASPLFPARPLRLDEPPLLDWLGGPTVSDKFHRAASRIRPARSNANGPVSSTLYGPGGACSSATFAQTQPSIHPVPQYRRRSTPHRRQLWPIGDHSSVDDRPSLPLEDLPKLPAREQSHHLVRARVGWVPLGPPEWFTALSAWIHVSKIAGKFVQAAPRIYDGGMLGSNLEAKIQPIDPTGHKLCHCGTTAKWTASLRLEGAQVRPEFQHQDLCEEHAAQFGAVQKIRFPPAH